MNSIRIVHTALAGLLALGTASAMAQAKDAERAQKMQAELQKRFAAADANADGKLTKDEANGKMPMVFKHFDEIDSAHTGAVTMADIAAFVRTQRVARNTAR
jgi:hypothetical protein